MDMQLEGVVVPASDVPGRELLHGAGLAARRRHHHRRGLPGGAGDPARLAGVFHHAGTDARVPGPDPQRGSHGSFLSSSDPDGNGWVPQEVTTRRPGRLDPSVTTFASTSDLAAALRRAAAAHGEHEARSGTEDPNWPDWYAGYMAREQAGTELPL